MSALSPSCCRLGPIGKPGAPLPSWLNRLLPFVPSLLMLGVLAGCSPVVARPGQPGIPAQAERNPAVVSPSADPAGLSVEPVTGMAFVRVPAGAFTMGSSDAQVETELARCRSQEGPECVRALFAREQPQHSVRLDDYWIGRHEVTVAQYQRFIDAGGYATPRYWSADGWRWRTDHGITGPDCPDRTAHPALDQPAVCVSWYEAEAFTRWLSEASGRHMRLPSEAEWEKAARGPDGRIFPWGNTLPEPSLLNYDQSALGGPAAVGSYPAGASPYGALDMAGNVWEWVEDWFAEDYYAHSPAANPSGPAGGAVRVLRGGGFFFNDRNVRTAMRSTGNPADRAGSMGFRVVMEGGK